MPKRMIDGEIRKSASLARVSIQAGHVFVLLMTCADDQGRADGDVLVLRSELFPRRRDVTDDQVAGWIDELVVEGCIHRYRIGGEEFVHFPAWENYQRLRSKSKPRRPDPAGHCAGCEPVVLEEEEAGSEKREARGVSSESPQAAATRRNPPRDSARVVNRRAPNAGRTEAPAELAVEEFEALRAWAEAKQPGEVGRLADHVESCLDHFRSKGERRVDWLATIRNWVKRAKSFEGGSGAANPRGGGGGPVGPIERAARELWDVAGT